jgi:hypothetical protein
MGQMGLQHSHNSQNIQPSMMISHTDGNQQINTHGMYLYICVYLYIHIYVEIVFMHEEIAFWNTTS